MTDRGTSIAQIALAHADCSAFENRDRYLDVVARDADRAASIVGYYLDHPPSTCALFALGVLRLAGCNEPECVAPYVTGRLGQAVADVQALARRADAWVTSSPPMPLLRAGDIWIIADGQGGDPHVGVCIEDEVLSAGLGRVRTVEGGQDDGHGGSSAIRVFTRQIQRGKGRVAMGSRFLLGFAEAAQMPVPDVIDNTAPERV